MPDVPPGGVFYGEVERMVKEIFISYSSLDFEKVKLVKNELKDNPFFIPIIIANDREPLKPLAQKVIDGIVRASAVVPILTPNSIRTQWINQEIGFAQAMNKPMYPIIEESILNELKGFIHKEVHLPYTYCRQPVKQTESKHFLRQFQNILKDLEGDSVANHTIVNPPQVEAPVEKTAFQRRLEEAEKFREEQLFDRQKKAMLGSPEGIEAVKTEFARLVEIAERKLLELKQKEFQIERQKSADGGQLAIIAGGFTVSFAIQLHHLSTGVEFHLYLKYWEGRKGLGSGGFYPFDKPRVIREFDYISDMDRPTSLCWTSSKKTQYHSEQLVDQGLGWLVEQVISEGRKRR